MESSNNEEKIIIKKDSNCFRFKSREIILNNNSKITIKIKLNSEKSIHSYLFIHNEEYNKSPNKQCMCSDFINDSNLLRLSSNGEWFIGCINLLNKRNPISEKFNFQESMISLTFQFDFNEENIIILDSKNKEIFKVPIPDSIQRNNDHQIMLEGVDYLKSLKYYVGISSCDLDKEDDDDFILKFPKMFV